MSGESIWTVVIIGEKNDFSLVISILMQNDQCNFFQSEHL